MHPLIESILKANDKGKVKIKKVVDNTAKDVEVLVEIPPGVSPDVTMSALYAFTDCEVSMAPNAASGLLEWLLLKKKKKGWLSVGGRMLLAYVL